MKFLADIETLGWTLEGTPSYEEAVCEVGFRSNGLLPVTFIHSLEFGIKFLDLSETILYEKSYPDFGEQYLYTDQDYIHAENIYDLQSDTDYKVFVWAKYGEQYFSSEFSVKTLKYPQPYPLWTYDEQEKKWIPPFPPPQDGYNYKWAPEHAVWVRSLGYNEETQTRMYSIYDAQSGEWIPYEFPEVD